MTVTPPFGYGAIIHGISIRTGGRRENAVGSNPFRDSTFPDFCESLAFRLVGHGTLYTPHCVVQPNTRTAPPPIQSALAEFGSEEGTEVLQEVIRLYLEVDEGRGLTLQHEGRSVELRGGAPSDEAVIRALLSSEARLP